jgi:hypothetical protein
MFSALSGVPRSWSLAVSAGDSDLRIRPGRIRGTRAPKPKSFINQVLRAAKKAGHSPSYTAAGKRSSSYGRSTFGRGRISFSRNCLFSPARGGEPIRLEALPRPLMVVARIGAHIRD